MNTPNTKIITKMELNTWKIKRDTEISRSTNAWSYHHKISTCCHNYKEATNTEHMFVLPTLDIDWSKYLPLYSFSRPWTQQMLDARAILAGDVKMTFTPQNQHRMSALQGINQYGTYVCYPHTRYLLSAIFTIVFILQDITPADARLQRNIGRWR